MDKWKRAVVRVWKRMSQKKDEFHGEFIGTAFLITPNLLLTAKHVIEGVSKEDIILQGPAWDDCGFYAISECSSHHSEDVAILTLKKSANIATVISLASEQVELQSGEKVTLAGYRALEYAEMETKESKISAYSGIFDLEIAEVGSVIGMSGGPVIKHGKLVGIIRARSKVANHSYLLRLNAFRSFIETNKEFQRYKNAITKSRLRDAVLASVILMCILLSIIVYWWKKPHDIMKMNIIYPNKIDSNFDNRIILIPFENEVFNSESPQKIYADLTRKLSEADAKVIAFDMQFIKLKDQNKQDRLDFIEAMKQAKRRGTSVIIGINDCDDNGEPFIIEGYEQSASGVGILCMDFTIDSATHTFKSILALKKEQKNNNIYYGLSFKIIECFSGGKLNKPITNSDEIFLELNEHDKKVIKVIWEKIEQRELYCPILQKNDLIANLAIDIPNPALFKKIVELRDYDDLKDKIVIVGTNTKMDLHPINNEGMLIGMAFHACAVNALLQSIK